MELIRSVAARVYPVGRLDYASEGLLLLTNDGELRRSSCTRLRMLPKTYMVKVAGTPSADGLAKLRSGVYIQGKAGRRQKTAPAKIKPIREADNPWYEVTLIEGKNRQIRQMFETSAIMWRKSSGCATDRCSWMFLPASFVISPRKRSPV